MRHSLFTIALFFLFNTTKAQCPPDAHALIVFYVHITGLGPNGEIIDTSNSFLVSNFQPNTTVYFYNAYNTLIDSVYTSSTGYGAVNLSPSVHDSIGSLDSGGSFGIATNGICTIPVTAIALLPVKVSKFTVSGNNNNITISWQTEMDEPGTKYIVQESEDGNSFTDLKTIVSTSTNTGHYSYSKYFVFSKTKYFRIKVVSKDQRVFYSETKAISKNISGELVISALAGKRVSVRVPENFVNGSYSVYNEAGSLLTSGRIFSTTLMLSPGTGNGVYFVKVADSNGRRVTRSFIISD